MCAVKFVHISSDIGEPLKEYEIEENSYSPEGKVKGLNSEVFKEVPVIKEIAIVSTINNDAGLNYDGKLF